MPLSSSISSGLSRRFSPVLTSRSIPFAQSESSRSLGYTKEAISHPFCAAPFRFRTPSTRNCPYLWRLFLLVLSTCNF